MHRTGPAHCNHPLDSSIGIGRYHRPMDWTLTFWLNRVACRSRLGVVYMSEKKTVFATRTSENGRYVVIGLRCDQAFPELVAACCDEASLSGPMAAPSFIGIGFSSREETVAVIPNRRWMDPESPKLRVRHDVNLKDTWRIACTAFQQAIAVGVLLLCSKSAVGAALRTLIGT